MVIEIRVKYPGVELELRLLISSNKTVFTVPVYLHKTPEHPRGLEGFSVNLNF